MKPKGYCCDNGTFNKKHDCLKSNPEMETKKLIKSMTKTKAKVVKSWGVITDKGKLLPVANSSDEYMKGILVTCPLYKIVRVEIREVRRGEKG